MVSVPGLGPDTGVSALETVPGGLYFRVGSDVDTRNEFCLEGGSSILR